MIEFQEKKEYGVGPSIALYSILGFWFFYALLVTLRGLIMGFDAQGEMAIRRVIVTAIGIAVTWIFYLVFRRFDSKSLRFRILAGFSLAIFFALAMAAANFYAFNAYDPSSFHPVSDAERQMYGSNYAMTQIVEDAINRYFFLSAWAALYLALSYANKTRLIERRAASLELAAQRAELRSLRYQVNPHFLFNTLNSLSTLVMKDRRDEAEHMILSLSHFYRTSLTGDPLDDVPLDEEVNLQKLYLDIESVRFPKRLVTEIDIPPALMNACVPSLILQPLIENAIKYGVSRTNSPVLIKISASELSGNLRLSVVDDGDNPPLPKDGGNGIGLANVRDRLNARFGTAAQIEYGPVTGGGFAVYLTLPLIWQGC